MNNCRYAASDYAIKYNIFAYIFVLLNIYQQNKNLEKCNFDLNKTQFKSN